MTIELDDTSYIVGIWFSEDPKTGNNWLACAVKNPENPNQYQVMYRFRYTKDNKIFNSEDDKNWMGFLSKDNLSEDYVIHFLDMAQNKIEEGYPIKDRILVKGGLKSLIELSKDKPWMHIKAQKLEGNKDVH